MRAIGYLSGIHLEFIVFVWHQIPFSTTSPQEKEEENYNVPIDRENKINKSKSISKEGKTY